MYTCPCCNAGRVAFLYDLCPTCGWEFHGERNDSSEVVKLGKFANIPIGQWRQAFMGGKAIAIKVA